MLDPTAKSDIEEALKCRQKLDKFESEQGGLVPRHTLWAKLHNAETKLIKLTKLLNDALETAK